MFFFNFHNVFFDLIFIQVRPPSMEEAQLITEGKTYMGFLYPAISKDILAVLQENKATAIAMDCIPRTLSRGQTYDALSSQANIGMFFFNLIFNFKNMEFKKKFYE